MPVNVSTGSIAGFQINSDTMTTDTSTDSSTAVDWRSLKTFTFTPGSSSCITAVNASANINNVAGASAQARLILTNTTTSGSVSSNTTSWSTTGFQSKSFTISVNLFSDATISANLKNGASYTLDFQVYTASSDNVQMKDAAVNVLWYSTYPRVDTTASSKFT
jgi:hypothetical protein